jgi:hypothetical protein
MAVAANRDMIRLARIALGLLGTALAGCSSTPPPAERPPPPPAHAPSAGDDSEPREPATEPIAPDADGGVSLYGAELDPPCPLELPGVIAEVEPVQNGISIVLRTHEDPGPLREAVRAWFDDLMAAARTPGSGPESAEPGRPTPLVTVRARAELSDAPGGALIVFVPDDRDDLESLRDNLRVNARAMLEAAPCGSLAPGLELFAAR